jgi:hypothetical protein
MSGSGGGTPEEPEILRLSRQQLQAYCRADLDAFCACFHPEVEVLAAEGVQRMTGLAAFREQYARLFTHYREVTAEVTGRLVVGPHVVEHERWARVDRNTGERLGGEVLVRYTASEGKIRWVQFFAPE